MYGYQSWYKNLTTQCGKYINPNLKSNTACKKDKQKGVQNALMKTMCNKL